MRSLAEASEGGADQFLNLADPGAFDHRVQFYRDDTFLYDVVTDFFKAGLDVGESALAILTEAHQQGLRTQLEARGVNVDDLTRSGQLVLLDARDTLNAFMAANELDAERFEAHMNPVLVTLASRSHSGRVRAFGEMVDLLWRDGDAAATVRLEKLWNAFSQRHPFMLLCGCDIAGFADEAESTVFSDTCAARSHAAPTEDYRRFEDPEPRLREVARLQQRARALEGEIEQRKVLEQALRTALADRERLEAELRRQNEDLSRTVRFSEMFVGILGHDLRNPLSAITTAASLLRKRADSDKVGRPAARILNSAGRMGRMIDQLLDFTRIRLGEGIPIERARTDLAEICRLATDEFESTGQSSLLVVDSTGDPVGAWDVDRLLQLVSNLVSNALTHGDVGHSVKIRLDGHDPDHVVLGVTNAGVVPDKILPVLFEPFRSGINEKQERSNGLGLGLFISQQIVLAHSGHIDVTSSQADGTCVTVRLPRTPPRPEPAFMLAGDVA